MFEIRKLSSILRFDNESQKKVASLPILVLDSRSRFADLSIHSQLWLCGTLKSVPNKGVLSYRSMLFYPGSPRYIHRDTQVAATFRDDANFTFKVDATYSRSETFSAFMAKRRLDL